MYIKIIFILLALSSFVFLAWYLVIGNNSTLVDDTTKDANPVGTTFPSYNYQSEENLVRTPGTIKSFKENNVSDQSIVQNKAVTEVAEDFFELTENKKLYGMYYDSVSGVISITLYGLDTKKARAEAEDYILDELPYTKDQWCNFVVRVFTNEYENPQLGGQELGLSFCSGAVQL